MILFLYFRNESSYLLLENAHISDFVMHKTDYNFYHYKVILQDLKEMIRKKCETSTEISSRPFNWQLFLRLLHQNSNSNVILSIIDNITFEFEFCNYYNS